MNLFKRRRNVALLQMLEGVKKSAEEREKIQNRPVLSPEEEFEIFIKEKGYRAVLSDIPLKLMKESFMRAAELYY